MARFVDLPLELLPEIFEVGCEGELQDIQTRRHPRRRKAFASLVRNVCSEWRDIIDSGPSQERFWIARLTLVLPVPPERFCFARELALFKHNLPESHGCDLIIRFTDSKPIEDIPLPDIAALDSRSSTNIRLFIHGMAAVLPFQRQLACLHMDLSQPQVDRQFCQLLDSIKHAPRLAMIIFDQIRWPTDREDHLIKAPLLREIWMRAPAPSFGPWFGHQGTENPVHCHSLQRFQNLQELSLSNPGWLSEIALPPAISRLIIRVPTDTFIDIPILITKRMLCKTVTKLLVGHDVLNNPPAQRRKWSPIESEPLAFPRLLDLDLQGLSTDLMSLLANLYFPNVEIATVRLDWERTGTSTPSAFRFLPPRFNSLSKLTFTLYDSCEDLSVLEYFTKAPIRFLEIQLGGRGKLGDDFKAQAKRCFSCFDPQTLKIHAYDWTFSCFILKALEMANIRDLFLIGSPFSIRSPSEANLGDSIILPQLRNIFLTNMPMSDASTAILTLRSLSLLTLSIELSAQDESTASWANASPVEPVSVAHLCYSQIPLSVTGSLLREYFHPATNVEYLTLDIGSNWSINFSPESIFLAVYPPEVLGLGYCTSICDALKPEDDFLPFPHLRDLCVSFPVEVEQSEKVLPLFSDVFHARGDAGGSILVLTEIEQREVEYEETAQGLRLRVDAPTDYHYMLFRFTFQMADCHPSLASYM